jgi:hypothetical protein
MKDVYNKGDKAGEIQAMKARLAHLGDCLIEVRREEKDIIAEMDRLSKKIVVELGGVGDE